MTLPSIPVSPTTTGQDEINDRRHYRSMTLGKMSSKFIVKVNLLGLRISFDYTIENEEVKIQEYTGSSSRVIITSFVSTLCNGSFSSRGIRELTLNTGLKCIGNHCFSHNIIRHINLLETVKFVGIDAFEYGAFYGANYQRIFKKMYTNALIL